MIADFEILNPILGGTLIGLAASGMMWSTGRVMGISGIVGGLLGRPSNEHSWRWAFVAGLFVGALFLPSLGFTVLEIDFPRGLWAAGLGGLLVGFGTGFGNGCTSGHGVCGISRLSPRSMVATGTFMMFGFLTVFLFNSFFS